MFIVENKMEGSKFRIYLIVIFLAILTSQCLSIEDDQSDKADATTKGNCWTYNTFKRVKKSKKSKFSKLP